MAKESDKVSLPVVIAVAVILSVTLALSVFLFRQTSIFPASSKEVKKRVEVLENKGEPKKALKEVARLSAEKRSEAEMLLIQGRLWYLEAFKKFEEDSWAEYGKNPEDWFEGKEVDNAVHLLTRALDAEKTRDEALLLLGVIYMEKGWFHKADEAFKEILRKDSNNLEAVLNYGVLKTRQHKFDQALTVLQKGLKIFPDSPELLKNIFWIYAFHDIDYKNAIKYGDEFLKKAKRGDPAIVKIKWEMYDIVARFPEYDSDTLELNKEKPKEFEPRKKRLTPLGVPELYKALQGK